MAEISTLGHKDAFPAMMYIIHQLIRIFLKMNLALVFSPTSMVTNSLSAVRLNVCLLSSCSLVFMPVLHHSLKHLSSLLIHTFYLLTNDKTSQGERRQPEKVRGNKIFNKEGISRQWRSLEDLEFDFMFSLVLLLVLV